MIKKITALLAVLMLTIGMAACGSVTSSTAVAPSETPSDMATSTAVPVTSAGTVDELIAMVNNFVANGEITGNAENGLLAKLETIQQKVLNGQLDPAANEMGAFINQVEGQAGKKISAAAATALIAKAQVVTAAFLAGIPVTGEGTVVAATATASVLGDMSKPTPLGSKLVHQAQWDALALQVVQSVGFTTFDYDLYQLPVNTTWEETLAFYTTEAAIADWGDAPNQTNEMTFGHYAVWSVTGSDGMTNYFIVAQVDTADGSYTLNIFGTK
jgi:uncharacterized cupredoxin-like copper-binding protein